MTGPVELFDLRLPVSIEMASDLRDMLSKLYQEGTTDALFLVEPRDRQFFEDEFKAVVAGLRGSDQELGHTYLVMRKNLRHPGDGILPGTESV